MNTNDESEVEKAIVRIDATLPGIATKDEMQKGFSEIIKWVVGTAFAGIAIFVTVMTFVLNNAVPKTATVQPSPTIIYLPNPLLVRLRSQGEAP